ncbi:ATP phosphoribosyltransferase regulatory subunit [Slackia exigua]|uniref:ATP phosphoribosyltransferase regulatory subunit n=1 Tax=Slackia exigua TaxID=84109 RepID=UPI002549F004|nr:ATP phosphoribosyltransferase regulatory subunit [Slackia exigua]MDK7724316.1 ATP phosphoribosyltransferase regulatory subunit [Slackia exigua]MDK7725644.1 ATP phosphoribosyltransferase regulatory subunit [Slackia exigua]
MDRATAPSTGRAADAPTDRTADPRAGRATASRAGKPGYPSSGRTPGCAGLIPETFSSDELEWDTRVTLALDALYRMSGYERYRMNKFEPYDLYLEHRGFLRDNAVISFTDPRGRLMALKPDVTMSIVKNASVDAAVERLFYIENVFRVPPGGSEFAEIAQMGLECLGCDSGRVQSDVDAEVVALACRTLDVCGGRSRLAVSHMGFLSALLDVCLLEDEPREQALRCIRLKNAAGLADVLRGAGAPSESQDALLGALAVSSPLSSAVEFLKALPLSRVALEAVEALEALVKRLVASGEEPCAIEADPDAAGRPDAIEADSDATRKPDTAGEEPCAMRKEPDAFPVAAGAAAGGRGVSEGKPPAFRLEADRLFFDLSLVGEAGYYTGLAFQGYIEGLPRAVLAGGRYDGLMEKVGRSQGAAGFALYLGEIAPAFTGGRA